jgi:hypothetical protein
VEFGATYLQFKMKRGPEKSLKEVLLFSTRRCEYFPAVVYLVFKTLIMTECVIFVLVRSVRAFQID